MVSPEIVAVKCSGDIECVYFTEQLEGLLST